MLLCVQYSKKEEARFLSHLDLMTAMERAFRRAALPLAFSEGFNPHPRVSYASALAVGVTSDAEYLDVQLTDEKILAAELVERLNKVLPRGLQVIDAVLVTKRTASLMAVINVAHYQVEVPFYGGKDGAREEADNFAEDTCVAQKMIQEEIDRVMNTPTYFVRREGKKGLREIDIRPGIRQLAGSLKRGKQGKKLLLELKVQTGSSGNVKPEEVVKMVSDITAFRLGENIRIHRLGLYIHTDTHDWSPLEIS